ncbi:hypothetical protein [Butyrivibrio sp. AC2005]|uniref:hypothetical protein n=1 Tax=Butyrivibrio sp. AC2005 TaxID=1280672 RepID=UPI0003F90673|nr:hypothetical protein [Butyrivibrio sp. AC2005]
MEENKRIKWHPGFYGALEFELRKYRDVLIFESEHELSKEPLLMDMLVIKKKNSEVIDESFARIFRGHNVIEYKSPDDELSIDQMYKTVGYACLYKSLGERVNKISADDMSISIFRSRHPRKLFATLNALGAVIKELDFGVYYIQRIVNIPLQVIVTSELEPDNYYALKILTRNANREDISAFIDMTSTELPQGDKDNVDAVLQVSVSANYDLYQEIRRDNTMCEALRELMKDEIEKDVKEGIEQGIERGIERGIEQGIERGRDEILFSLVHDGLLDVKEAAKRAGKSVKAFNSGMKKIYG